MCKERWCPASILVPPLLACWCWGLGLRLVVLPQLQQLSGCWAAPGSAAGSKLGGEVGGGSWPPWAPHLTAEIPRGFSEPHCERTSCWRGQPADLLCPAAHWRCLEDVALKTTPYGLRLVLPSQVFSVLGSVQPPLSWRKRKPPSLFPSFFIPFVLGELLKGDAFNSLVGHKIFMALQIPGCLTAFELSSASWRVGAATSSSVQPPQPRLCGFRVFLDPPQFCHCFKWSCPNRGSGSAGMLLGR